MHPQDVKEMIRLAMRDLQIQTNVSFSHSGHYGKDVEVTVTLSYQGEVIATSTDSSYCPD